MSAIALVVLVAFTVLVLGTVYLLNYFIDRRLDRLENSLRELRVDIARFDQKLDDHIKDHPGPSTRLVRP
jgi:4-hydroxybenzoate polyprenyltransferase